MEEVVVLHAKNGDTFETDAIAKEMEHVKMAFKILLEGNKAFKCSNSKQPYGF